MKACSKCGEWKGLECFHRSAGNKDGLKAICKPCNIAAAGDYAKANRAKANDASYRWAKRNPEKRAEIRAAWRAANPMKLRSQEARYKEKHKEAISDRRQKYNESHKAERAAYRSSRVVIDLKNERARYAKNPGASNKKSQLQTSELADCYVRNLIARGDVPANSIPQSLVELKREQIRLHRLARELKQEINHQLENENGN